MSDKEFTLSRPDVVVLATLPLPVAPGGFDFPSAPVKPLGPLHSPLPWKLVEEIGASVIDQSGLPVMNNESYYPTQISRADMALCVRCVNLLEAPTDDPLILFARAILAGDPIACDAVKDILRR